MSTVLVLVENDGSACKSSSLPGITAGQQLAKASGGELHLLVLGSGVANAAAGIAAAGYGATKVHVVDHGAMQSSPRRRPSAPRRSAARRLRRRVT
jgi:electron transfer flavoprotein alpha subunit